MLRDSVLPYLDPFVRNVSTLATLAVLSVLCIVVAAGAPRRRSTVLATGLAFAGIGALTLPPASGWLAFSVQSDPFGAIASALRPQPGDLTAWQHADGPANVVLFFPLGLTLALMLRRPIAAALLGSLTSAAIEAYQAGTGDRVGSFADILANSVGAAAGATVASVVLLVASTTRRLVARRRRSSGSHHQPGEASTI